jgi:hypothetical protein
LIKFQQYLKENNSTLIKGPNAKLIDLIETGFTDQTDFTAVSYSIINNGIPRKCFLEYQTMDKVQKPSNPEQLISFPS